MKLIFSELKFVHGQNNLALYKKNVQPKNSFVQFTFQENLHVFKIPSGIARQTKVKELSFCHKL